MNDRLCKCGCGESLAGMRVDAVYYTDSCRMRAKRVRSPNRERVKNRARYAVHEALRKGVLTRPDHCESCGRPSNKNLRKPDIEAHHDDYSKPLDVRWLCKRCHGVFHAEKRRAERKRRNGNGVSVYVAPGDTDAKILEKVRAARDRKAAK